jgi:hypothetical protein
MIEELYDQDEATRVNVNKTEEEVKAECLACDDNLEFDAHHIKIKEGDCVFMVMVHPVDPQHFTHASSMVSRCLAKAYMRNSMPKGFHKIVPTVLHSYEDVFSLSLNIKMGPHHWTRMQASPGFWKVYPMILT